MHSYLPHPPVTPILYSSLVYPGNAEKCDERLCFLERNFSTVIKITFYQIIFSRLEKFMDVSCFCCLNLITIFPFKFRKKVVQEVEEALDGRQDVWVVWDCLNWIHIMTSRCWCNKYMTSVKSGIIVGQDTAKSKNILLFSIIYLFHVTMFRSMPELCQSHGGGEILYPSSVFCQIFFNVQ